MVVALIALAVALGGTGYAVTQLPKNSVGTKQLKNNAVTGAKVKNRSLSAADFRPGTLKPGPAGPQGPAGPTGATGARGPSTSAAGGAVGVDLVATGNPGETVVSIGSTVPGAQAASQTGPITVDGPSRLIITASVTIDAITSDPNGGFVNCQPQIRALPSGEWGTPGIVQDGYGFVPRASISTFTSIPMTASADVSAGTYDAQVTCYEDTLTVASAAVSSITVVATGR